VVNIDPEIDVVRDLKDDPGSNNRFAEVLLELGKGGKGTAKRFVHQIYSLFALESTLALHVFPPHS
jgi:hypothetical protein